MILYVLAVFKRLYNIIIFILIFIFRVCRDLKMRKSHTSYVCRIPCVSVVTNILGFYFCFLSWPYNRFFFSRAIGNVTPLLLCFGKIINKRCISILEVCFINLQYLLLHLIASPPPHLSLVASLSLRIFATSQISLLYPFGYN